MLTLEDQVDDIDPFLPAPSPLTLDKAKPWGCLLLAGYCMTHETAVKWWARMVGKDHNTISRGENDLAPIRICNVIEKERGWTLLMVGDYDLPRVRKSHCILIVREEYYRGWKGMPLSEAPRLEPDERAGEGKTLLDEYDVSEDEYAYRTLLRTIDL